MQVKRNNRKGVTDRLQQNWDQTLTQHTHTQEEQNNSISHLAFKQLKIKISSNSIQIPSHFQIGIDISFLSILLKF